MDVTSAVCAPSCFYEVVSNIQNTTLILSNAVLVCNHVASQPPGGGGRPRSHLADEAADLNG